MRPDLNQKEKKLKCEVFYKNNDITALRWITEIRLFIKPYNNLVTISYQASNKNCILLNSKKIDFHDFSNSITENIMPLTNNSII